MGIFKKTALCILVSASLVACGGGGGGDSAGNNSSGTTGITYKIENGAFQKGPFIAGTTVTIQELDDNLQATGKTYTAVTDAVGRFSIANVKTRFVEVFANGFYYDELTNKNSVAAITLRSIIDLSTNSTTPSINTLTTLQVERLRELKKSGKTFQQAQLEAKNAVLGAFGISPVGIESLNSINLLGSTPADESLLRATVALLQVAKEQGGSVEANLTVLISKLATDLKDDGQANEIAKDLVVLIKNAENAVDTAFIGYRLRKYFGDKTNAPITKVIGVSVSPKLSPWLRAGGTLTINNVENQLLLRDDGTLWVWPLQANAKLKQVMSVKDVVELSGYDWGTKDNMVLTKDGTVYTIDTSLQATKILEDITQIVPLAYVRADNGGVYLWGNNQRVQELPAMARLISRRGKGSSFSSTIRAGVGIDGHLYFIRRLTNLYVKDLGKHEAAEALICTNPTNTPYDSTTDFKYPAILDIGQWFVADSNGSYVKSTSFSKESILSTSLADNTYMANNESFTANLVVTNDNSLWYWDEASNTFAKRAECAGAQKIMGFNVFTTSGLLKPYYNQTSQKFCDGAVMQDITALGLSDIVSAAPFIAVKKDGKLVTKLNDSTIIETSVP